MPVYEYRCCACGHLFEHFVSMKAVTTETECPKCGKKAKRKFSPPRLGGLASWTDAEAVRKDPEVWK